MIDRRPALVAKCLGVADVVTGVTFAREQGLALSIKGGGHNIAGLAVREAGLMLDLSLMRGVWVDADRTRAAYGEHYDRLARVKGVWDPTNLFSANKNIAPVGVGS